MSKNPFTLLEYDPIKLLNNPQKVAAIFEVRDGSRDFDPTYPISVELHLTDLCNLKCPWCTDLAMREKNMASQDLSKLEALFADFAKHNVGVTIEGGGEPTVHRHFAEIVGLAQRYKLDIGLISNGVKPILELANAFKWIRISIDAASTSEYILEKGVQRFDKVMENLKNLAALPQRQFLLGVGYVMTNRNTQDLLHFIQRLDDMGVDYFYGRPVEEMAELTPDLKMLYDIKSHWETHEVEKRRLKLLMNLDDRIQKDNEGLPCIGHALSCVIQANGDVVMCEKRRHDPVTFGNINQSSFAEIWGSEKRKAVSRKLLDPNSQKGCEVCRITKFNRYFSRLGQLKTKNFI